MPKISNFRLEQHPEYWVGLEHAFFFGALHRLLQYERSRYTSETERRREWIADRAYLFPALMLVGSFLYVEGECKSGWIQKYGGKRKRELYSLRIIRNAIVHEAGDLTLLNSYKKPNARKGMPPDIRAYVRRFIGDLKAGRVLNEHGQRVAAYIELDRSGIVKLNDKAFIPLKRLFGYVLLNAQRLLGR